jgi:hypothetical protein
MKNKGRIDITTPISIRSTFRSRSRSGIVNVSPPETRKFRNVTESILFIAASAAIAPLFLTHID